MSQPKYLVSMGDVERELNAHMKALQGEGAAPLRRARMSNLVICCTSFEQSILINEQVPIISAVHPARVILVVGDPQAPDRELTARVTVRPLGKSKYTCTEMVTLHAAGSVVARLPFAVRALVIGDLPINLWWAAPTPPPLIGALLHDLGERAQQIIYDSIGWPDPARGVNVTAAWLEHIERGGVSWRVASDLNWRRLKYWRRLLTQSLEPIAAPGVVETANEILVEHGPHAVIQAWELTSWLTGQLGWKVQAGKVSGGKEMAWRFNTGRGEGRVRIRRLDEGTPEIHKVRLACKLGTDPGAMVFTLDGPQRLALTFEGVDVQPRTITAPPQSPAELVGRQLSDRERDPVFHEAMATAQVMANSLLH